MTVSKHISNLLYRYDCVIVPDFGGFVTNSISARVNQITHVFYPPTKQITFNAHLKNNDGLLANHIASVEGISFENASDKIASEVQKWTSKVQSETLTIESIGDFSLNKDHQLIFEPVKTVNYLTESFGMSTVNSPKIKRETYKKQSDSFVAKKSSNFFKYAATAAIVLTLGTLGWNGYQTNQLKEMYVKQQLDVEKKIQSATFVIGDPLPTIQLTVEKETPKNFHIVAGSFAFLENAEKKLTQLKAKGFQAHILGKNKWGLTQVAFASFETRAEAYQSLKNIRYNHSEDAWLLVKKLQ